MQQSLEIEYDTHLKILMLGDSRVGTLPQFSNYQGLFVRRSTKEDRLIEEFKNYLDKLGPTSKEEDLKDFFKQTLALTERANLLFANENPVLSLVSTSPLSKTFKKILSDLNKSTKYIVDYSELTNLNQFLL